eukprot:gb/GEZN01002137.1/.p1 GENE.gb/GEZN01002137.1/~~gb/GEZN01002137.1/.p1  ORF type:complete len:768 (-),score=150.62 gb/GEZN01002137.1/:196-2499(-)
MPLCNLTPAQVMELKLLDQEMNCLSPDCAMHVGLHTGIQARGVFQPLQAELSNIWKSAKELREAAQSTQEAWLRRIVTADDLQEMLRSRSGMRIVTFSRFSMVLIALLALVFLLAALSVTHNLSYSAHWLVQVVQHWPLYTVSLILSCILAAHLSTQCLTEQPRISCISSPQNRWLVSAVKRDLRPYTPTPWAVNGNFQSIMFGFFPHPIRAVWKDRPWGPPVYRSETLTMADGGKVSLDWMVECDSFSASAPCIIILPGVVGDASDYYLKRFAYLCVDQGWRVVVKSWRGIRCALDEQDPKPETWGWRTIQDLHVVLCEVKRRFPSALIGGWGMSYGGHVIAAHVGCEPDKRGWLPRSTDLPEDSPILNVLRQQHSFDAAVAISSMFSGFEMWRHMESNLPHYSFGNAIGARMKIGPANLQKIEGRKDALTEKGEKDKQEKAREKDKKDKQEKDDEKGEKNKQEQAEEEDAKDKTVQLLAKSTLTGKGVGAPVEDKAKRGKRGRRRSHKTHKHSSTQAGKSESEQKTIKESEVEQKQLIVDKPLTTSKTDAREQHVPGHSSQQNKPGRMTPCDTLSAALQDKRDSLSAVLQDKRVSLSAALQDRRESLTAVLATPPDMRQKVSSLLPDLERRMSRMMELERVSDFHSKVTVGFLPEASSVQEMFEEVDRTYLPLWENIPASNPLLCVQADDDPLIPPTVRAPVLNKIKKAEGIITVRTRRGGHCGFFEGFFAQTSWSDDPALRFIKAAFDLAEGQAGTDAFRKKNQ